MILLNSNGTIAIKLDSIESIKVYIDPNAIQPKVVNLEINGNIFEQDIISYPEDIPDCFIKDSQKYLEDIATERLKNFKSLVKEICILIEAYKVGSSIAYLYIDIDSNNYILKYHDKPKFIINNDNNTLEFI